MIIIYLMKLLEVKNLSVEFDGNLVVEDVSFDLNKGEVLSIVGPNGSGKTTLIKALLGILPHTGEIKWIPENIKIGYLPQRLDISQLIPITVQEFIKMNSSKQRNNPTKIQTIRDTLALFHGSHLINKNLINLSRGEFQRTLLSAALINEPEILILDEPTAGVDPRGEEAIYEHVFKLKQEKGISIIFISHDINLVYRFSDKVICINQTMTCSGAPESALTPEVLKKLYGEEISIYKHGQPNVELKEIIEHHHHGT